MDSFGKWRVVEVRSPVPELSLPKLFYSDNGLEPNLSEELIKTHREHHKAYLEKLTEDLKSKEKDADTYRRMAFNGSGVYLHTLYFEALNSNPKPPSVRLSSSINRDFGSLNRLVESLKDVSSKTQASGWCLLENDPFTGRLMINLIEKHGNGVLMGAKPILAIDLFEHAYYLQFKRDMKSYLDSIFEIIDWGSVSERFQD